MASFMIHATLTHRQAMESHNRAYIQRHMGAQPEAVGLHFCLGTIWLHQETKTHLDKAHCFVLLTAGVQVQGYSGFGG